MLKIHHPASIVREREKKLNGWETVRSTKYSNGVELQILIGFLPHGHAQSALSANRAFSLKKEGDDLHLVFSDEPATLLDFAAGARLTAESSNAAVLDACRFVPTVKVDVVSNGEKGSWSEDGGNLVAKFADGAEIALHAHGGHAHVEASKDGQPLKTFFNGADNTLYAFGVAAF